MSYKVLNLTGDSTNAARSKVRDGKFSLLVQDIDQQARRMGLVG